MVRRGTFLLATLIALLATIVQTAQARTGRAAYHAHTSAMVTASRYEPHGSVLLVTNPQNGRSVIVRVNDRGPFNGNRILDLSTGAFSQLYGGLGRGVGPVHYEVISRGNGYALASRGGSRRRSSWRRRGRSGSRHHGRRHGRHRRGRR
jgi:rare lipoprotein A